MYVKYDVTSIHIKKGFACLFVRSESQSACRCHSAADAIPGIQRGYYFILTGVYNCHTHTPLLLDEFLCRLDLFVELLDLLVMAVTLFVIRIELQALTHLAADQTRGEGRSEQANFTYYLTYVPYCQLTGGWTKITRTPSNNTQEISTLFLSYNLSYKLVLLNINQQYVRAITYLKINHFNVTFQGNMRQLTEVQSGKIVHNFARGNVFNTERWLHFYYHKNLNNKHIL